MDSIPYYMYIAFLIKLDAYVSHVTPMVCVCAYVSIYTHVHIDRMHMDKCSYFMYVCVHFMYCMYVYMYNVMYVSTS
jgi:hypothetical protein